MIDRFDELTDIERRVLAHAARTQAAWAEDPRYRNTDLDKAMEIKERWREIADSFHAYPYNGVAATLSFESSGQY